METVKCPKCSLVNWSSAMICKRCAVSFSNEPALAAGQSENDEDSPENVKQSAYKKIKWGLIIAMIGFTVTAGALYLGVFAGFSNTNREYLNRVKAFSLITLLPLAFVLAGSLELATGLSISTIVRKWEELPQGLGWLLGIAAFLLIIFVIMFVAAVVIFNFF